MAMLSDPAPAITPPDPDRWQKAQTDAERRRQEEGREEYRGTVWVSFRWILPLVKRLFRKTHT